MNATAPHAAAGPVTIVTGASSGIGLATAAVFAAAGARVVLAARRATALTGFVDAHPAWRDRLLAVPADVTRDEDVARLVAAAQERFGRVDILVNNAGIGLRALIADGQPADARALFEVNVFGLLRCTQAVLPLMREQSPGPYGVRGQIVNVGSILSLVATPRNGIYSATKFAVRALSDSLRLEEAPHGIEVILIMPSYTDTPFFDNLIRYDGPARVSKFRGQSPQAVARTILGACRRHRREVVLTVPAKLGALVKRLAPRFLDFCLVRVTGNP